MGNPDATGLLPPCLSPWWGMMGLCERAGPSLSCHAGLYPGVWKKHCIAVLDGSKSVVCDEGVV